MLHTPWNSQVLVFKVFDYMVLASWHITWSENFTNKEVIAMTGWQGLLLGNIYIESDC